jgi:hypothetical protein
VTLFSRLLTLPIHIISITFEYIAIFLVAERKSVKRDNGSERSYIFFVSKQQDKQAVEAKSSLRSAPLNARGKLPTLQEISFRFYLKMMREAMDDGRKSEGMERERKAGDGSCCSRHSHMATTRQS